MKPLNIMNGEVIPIYTKVEVKLQYNLCSTLLYSNTSFDNDVLIQLLKNIYILWA